MALDHVQGTLTLAAHEGALRARLFDSGGVLSESYSDVGEYELTIDLERVAFERLCQETELTLERVTRTNPGADASTAVVQATA